MPGFLRTVLSLLWKLGFIVLMLATLLVLPLLLLCKVFLRLTAYRLLVYRVAQTWGWLTVYTTGSRITLQGRENIPADGNYCFVGNHQSLFDIPAFLACVNRPVGFIAKRELKRFPVLRQWMEQMPSLFLDRQDARQALRLFAKGKQLLESGFPLMIFPEGGRSGKAQMRDWHPGSLRLPLMARAAIVPVAISGTWKIMGLDATVKPARINIRILPPIAPEDPLYKDKAGLFTHIHGTLRAALKDLDRE